MRNILKTTVLATGLAGAVCAADRPNVVLIVCDDLNDYITGIPGDKGHPQSITPNVEKLAKSGVAFRRAYSNNPVCAPSRSSFLTGIYPHTSGNLFWNKWFTNPVLKNSHSLMDYFRQNGYYTVGSGKLMHHGKPDEWNEFKYKADYGPSVFDGEKRVAHPCVPSPFCQIGGVDGSWGMLEDVPFANDDNPQSGWIYGDWSKVTPFRPGIDLTPDERNAAWAAARVKQFADEKSDQPFFLGVGFIRPHTPLHVSKKYYDMFPLDEIELPLIKDGDADDTHYQELFDPSQKGLRYYRMLLESFDGDKELAIKTFARAYLACVAAVDECIGQVVEAVDNSPLKDNTIIVLTADHGWQMGQKDYLFKNSPWEESCRIPFVVRAPGVAKAGAVAEHPISLIDLYPTLADLCGLSGDTRKNEQGAPLDGHSVRPFLEDPQCREWDGPDGALSMIYVGDSKKEYSAEEKNDLANQHWSYRTERWRYIRYNDGQEELYGHQKDPREWTNLADLPEYKTIKEKLNQEMFGLIGPMQQFAADKPKANVSVRTKAKRETKKAKWDWFSVLDQNKDNQVTEFEWLEWSKQLQKKKGQPYNEENHRMYFNKRDANGDGILTRKEFEESKK